MRISGRTSLVASAVTLGLLVVLLSAVALPPGPFHAAGVLLAELAHLAVALVAGSTLLKLLRAKPRNALELLVFASALGLALLSLLTLVIATLGLTRAASPWIADAVALLIGAGSLRSVIGYLQDAWVRLDLSFVMASRIPLLAALATVSLVHLAPPFLPSGPNTGAAEHALSAQADLRGDLRAAIAARPGADATPAEGLLLHGRLAAGEAGARLHFAVLAALLTAATFMHARRLLGGGTAAWAGLCIASSPALLLLDAASPSGTWIALTGFLCFAELSDWSARPAPGKVPLAFLFGGLCLAQGPAGLAAFLAVLAFLVLVEALVERHALTRLATGLGGLLAIALTTALPFLLVDALLKPDSAWTAAVERWRPVESSGPPSGGWAAAGMGLLEEGATVDAPLRKLAALGSLILGLLLLTALAPEAPDGLRHGVIMLLLALGAWALPPPWGTGALVLAAASLCAGATARGLLAAGGTPARLTAVLVAFAAPVTLLGAFNAGPDLFAGAGVMTGRTSREAAMQSSVPDHALMRAVAQNVHPRKDLVWLVGDLTDCQYEARVLRWREALDIRDGAELPRALRAASVSHVAVDHDARGVPPRLAFAWLERVEGFEESDRHVLYRVRPEQTYQVIESGPLPQEEEPRFR